MGILPLLLELDNADKLQIPDKAHLTVSFLIDQLSRG